MTISERVKNINPSQTLAITAQALEMKREGKKVISFAAGEPDFGTPENIREKAVSAIMFLLLEKVLATTPRVRE
jgi:aspartate aminotransferase